MRNAGAWTPVAVQALARQGRGFLIGAFCLFTTVSSHAAIVQEETVTASGAGVTYIWDEEAPDNGVDGNTGTSTTAVPTDTSEERTFLVPPGLTPRHNSCNGLPRRCARRG